MKDQIENSRPTIKEISSQYFVSSSNLRRIKNLSYLQLWKGPTRPPLRLHSKEHFQIKREIKFYNKNWEFLYTVGEVKQYIDEVGDCNHPVSLVRKIMTKEINLRYKKCNSRPFTFNAAKINAARKLFWAHFVDHLEPSTLIINVDESTFSRTSKINYSWSKAGRCSEVKNASFSGSTSMILAILSNGLWMCLLTPRTVNSEIFVAFVSKLRRWVDKGGQFGYSKVILLLDNCPSHQSSKSKLKLTELGYLIAFLPQYSPSWLQLEMAFSLIKRQLKTQVKSTGLNLNNVTNYSQFWKWMIVMNKDRVRNFFKEFYKQLKLWLHS